MIQRRVARLLLSLLLMVAWTTGGWAAACAQSASPAASTASAPHAMAHHGTQGGMHHHHPRPAPEKPAPRREMPECPVMVMNGGSCLGAAQVPATVAAPAALSLDTAAFAAADPIRDRLLPLSHFRPPEA